MPLQFSMSPYELRCCLLLLGVVIVKEKVFTGKIFKTRRAPKVLHGKVLKGSSLKTPSVIDQELLMFEILLKCSVSTVL